MATNVNPETGIRYGVVSLNSLEDWVFDEFFHNGTNLSYESAKKEYLAENYDADDESDDAIAEEEWEDRFNDEYQGEEDTYSLETDGMILQMSTLGGAYNVWVFESPHIAYCRQCSPCCPNAGNLDSKEENGVTTYDVPTDWYRKEE